MARNKTNQNEPDESDSHTLLPTLAQNSVVSPRLSGNKRRRERARISEQKGKRNRRRAQRQREIIYAHARSAQRPGGNAVIDSRLPWLLHSFALFFTGVIPCSFHKSVRQVECANGPNNCAARPVTDPTGGRSFPLSGHYSVSKRCPVYLFYFLFGISCCFFSSSFSFFLIFPLVFSPFSLHSLTSQAILPSPRIGTPAFQKQPPGIR